MKKIDQKEYLKKYLSGDKDINKKRKNKHKAHRTLTYSVKIIDDDIDTSQNEYGIDEELLLTGEDAPQIVGEYIETNKNSVAKWRNIAIKDEVKLGNDTITKKVNTNKLFNKMEPNSFSPERANNLFNQSRSRVSVDKQFSQEKSKYDSAREIEKYISSDQSPFRREEKIKCDSLSKTDRLTSRLQSKIDRYENTDQSPQRKRRNGYPNQSIDQTSPREDRPKCNDYSPPGFVDQSPPRKKEKKFSSDSPKRRRSVDQSPPRRYNVRPIDQSISKKRQKKDESLKMSPIRSSFGEKFKQGTHDSTLPSNIISCSVETLSGRKAGLQDATSLREENLKRRTQEENLLAQMTYSGRDTEINVRRIGRGNHNLEVVNSEQQLRKEAREKEKKEIYDRWGKGLKQIENQRERIDEIAYEISKPLARYANDEDLEKHLREQERVDDPMLEYMRSKKKTQEKKRNVPVIPIYEGSYSENRFGIRPGYRWDGVDRSNGYEKKWFDIQNEKRALQDDAYKYSVEDM